MAGLEAPLGELAAQAMEQIAERYESNEAACLRTAALVVEVDLGDSTDLLVTSLEDRPWVQIALLDEAARTLELRRDRLAQEEE